MSATRWEPPTQRVQATGASADGELLDMLASVGIAIVVVDPERRIRLFTPRAAEVLHLRPEDLGRPVSETAVDLGGLDAQIADVLASGGTHQDELEHADRTSYRVQIRRYVAGAVISFIDITELRRSIRTSQAARDQAAAIVEAVPTPLVVLDSNLRTQSWNGAFQDLFGGESGELLALGTWTAPGIRERLLATLTSVDSFDELEVEHTHAGRSRVLHIAARRLVGDRQLLVGIADITTLREAEHAREATRRERDAFLGAVSHELRTPLSAIMLWAEALRGFTQDDRGAEDAISAIIEAARGETQLVEDLLDLALSRTDGLTVVPERLDATRVVRDVVASLRPEADEKHIVIETTLEAAELVADPRRLRQIVANLVGNAIKFTPIGGAIGVTLESRDGSVVLGVRDTGEGLSPDALTHAFEPFWQADGSTTRTHGGLGIGLSLVRHLVDRHGGTIEVASAGDGQGTTFTVRFPKPASR